MPKRYHVVSNRDIPATLDSAALAGLLAKDGQFLLPMLGLIENAECAVDDLIDVMGRATLEAVLLNSAAGVAGPKQQGKKADRDVVYQSSQKGRVPLKERELRVNKPQRGGARRGRDPGLQGDPRERRTGRTDARNPDRGRLDPTLRDGHPRDGRDRRRFQEPGLTRDDRGRRTPA